MNAASPAKEPGAPAIELREVSKRFGPVWACRRARLRVERGEVHALVGENGAGKSTLMRLVAGLYQADEGEIRIGGTVVRKHSPRRALALGVGMVHQHFMLVPALTVAENVVLGREPRRGPLGLGLDLARAEREITELGERYGLRVDPRRRVADLTVGELQRVEIIKVLYRGADILVLDEPTAVLTPGEVAELLAVLKELQAGGKTAILITHKLDEVMSASQRITVMRRGETVAELRTADTTASAVATAMVGREVVLPERRGAAAEGEVVLELKGVSVAKDLAAGGGEGRLALEGIDLAVRRGEIVGIAGVEGNGQSELLEALVGLRPLVAGSIRIAGRPLGGGPSERYAAGLGFVPEDRHKQGLVLELSIADNLVLGRLHRFAAWGGQGPIDRGKVAAEADAQIRRYDIRPADPAAPARALSGGNQQKIVVARALAESERVLVVAQPTRGVDIGAIELIHKELLAARERGVAILLVSSELSELRALSDRIAVLYKGRLQAVKRTHETDPAELGRLMTGAASA